MQEIDALIKKLETGATTNSPAMELYDHLFTTIYKLDRRANISDLPRMIYEGFIDEIVEDLERIKAKLNKPSQS